MTSIKKTLAIILALTVLSVAVIVPLSAFTGSTATMPTVFTLIEDFDDGATGWNSVGSGVVFAPSDEHGYGTSGQSLKVDINGGWQGAKLQSCAVAIENDGLAFWLYIPEAMPSGKNFVVNLRVGTTAGDYGTKYEGVVPSATLTAGEHIITIPWSDFVLKSGSLTLTSGNLITQIEYTTNIGAGHTYYLDQVGLYKGQGTQSTFIPSTVKMPDNYKVIDDFNKASALSWAATNKATMELSADRGYGATGKSAHISWNESGWSGFKTSSNQSITMTGDGLAFWVYNAGAKITDLVVVLNCGGTKFEKKVTFEAGEQVFKIPWAEFTNTTAGAFDVSKTVNQIEFTKSVASANYYVDELSCYSSYIGSTLDMPDNFTLIEDFNGENTLAWAGTNKAADTFKISAERGYGADGKSAHVSWTESGWSGFKTASGKNIALTGDGLAFWAYNAGGELTSFCVVLLQDGVKYEAKITLKAGEAVYKIPYTDFVKNGTAVNTTKTVSQIEFTKSAGSADYFIDQIGCYSNPKKPAVSTIVFDTSTKCSASAVSGNGKGNSGGMDSVKWKLYDIENDPRFVRAGWFVADDVTAGYFGFGNVTNIGTLVAADVSSAYDFGNLVFWIKSEVANRKLKVTLYDSTAGKTADYVEFTVTEANKWQQVTIPVKDLLASGTTLTERPEFLKSINAVAFTGQGLTDTFKLGETFKIAGLRIYDSDVPDYSEYADLDTEATQPADDGSYATDSELIGRVSFEKDSYSGNSNFGEVKKVKYSEFAEELAGIKITAGSGIKDVGTATKGLSVWFGGEKETASVDASTLQDGYFSMWVRSNRAGMSFCWFIMDDTDNDAKTTMVQVYTIKEANKWEEVRVRLTDIAGKGMLDLEYLTKIQIRTGYGAFNWRYPYAGEQWLNTGDVLEVTAAMITEGKPINPFETKMSSIAPDLDDNQGGNTGDDNNDDNNDNTGDNIGDNSGNEGTTPEGDGTENEGTTPEDDGTENEGTTPEGDGTENEGAEDTTPDNSDTDTNADDDKPFNVVPIIVGIAAGVLGLAILVVIIVLIAKKKKA